MVDSSSQTKKLSSFRVNGITYYLDNFGCDDARPKIYKKTYAEYNLKKLVSKEHNYEFEELEQDELQDYETNNKKIYCYCPYEQLHEIYCRMKFIDVLQISPEPINKIESLTWDATSSKIYNKY